MAIKQIKDYQRKHDFELIGNELFILQESSQTTPGITRSTTLFDIMNKTIDYTYAIAGPNEPYPYKSQLSMNELVLIKDPISDSTTGNQLKYTDLKQLRNNSGKYKEFIHIENVELDFSLYTYFRCRIVNPSETTPAGFMQISFNRCSLVAVQEIYIEAINFFGKSVIWSVPNLKWAGGVPEYTPPYLDLSGNNPRPSIDLLKIISIEGREFIGQIIAKNIY